MSPTSPGPQVRGVCRLVWGGEGFHPAPPTSASPLTAVSPGVGPGPRALRAGGSWMGVSGGLWLNLRSFPTRDCQTALVG